MVGVEVKGTEKLDRYGSRRMMVILRQPGYEVNRKRVQQLMRLLGIEAAPGKFHRRSEKSLACAAQHAAA